MSELRDPRAFCREAGFDATLFLTYSFDPLFFEESVLPDMPADRVVVVVADARELDAALPRCVLQAAGLGRRYVLVPAALPGSFHPKLILRVGEEAASAWIGSGNLTQGGWGSNSELATHWPLGPADAGWLADLLDRLAGECAPSPLLRERLDLFRRHGGGAAPAPPVLFGTPARPLAEQLEARWAGRSFESVRLCTGSTDGAGAFLAWARDAFGIERAVIHVDPLRCSFDPAALAALGIDILIAPAPGQDALHAKCYWFSGPDGDAAVMGSANCSAAAWKRFPEPGQGAGRGLNAELVVVHDRAAAEDMGRVFEPLLGHPELLPAAALPARRAAAPALPPPPALRIAEASVADGILRLRLHGELPPEAGLAVEIVADGSAAPVEAVREGPAEWSAALPERFAVPEAPLYVRASAPIGGAIAVSPLRWVDDPDRIAREERRRIVAPNLSDLGRRGLSRKQRNKVVEAMRNAAALLFGNGPAFKDAVRGGGAGRRRRQDEDRPALGPVDPDSLLRSVYEARRTRPARSLASPGDGHSIDGIMRILLGAARDETVLVEGEDGIARGAKWKKPPSGGTGAGRRRDAGPERAQIARFDAICDSSLAKLESAEFRDGCAPDQLAKAPGFLLAVAMQGVRGGWYGAHRIAPLAERILRALARREWPDAPDRPGLLRHVRARLAAEPSGADAFDRAVGDGELWLLLLAALVRTAADPRNHRSVIRKAILIRDLVGLPVLYSHADPARLGRLARALDVPDADAALLRDGAAIAEALDELERLLARRFDGRNRRLVFGVRSCVFSPAGWRLIEPADGPAIVMDGIRLDGQLARPEVREALDLLLALMETTALENA